MKKLDLRSGSQRHRHFVGFFNVPVQAPTRDQPFYMVIPTRWGYGGHVLGLTPGPSRGYIGKASTCIHKGHLNNTAHI